MPLKFVVQRAGVFIVAVSVSSFVVWPTIKALASHLGAMDYTGWLLLVGCLLACFAVAVAWAAWINSHEAKREVSDLRYKLRRELGSDGL